MNKKLRTDNSLNRSKLTVQTCVVCVIW